METTTLQHRASHIRVIDGIVSAPGGNALGARPPESALPYTFYHSWPAISADLVRTHRHQMSPIPESPGELVDYMIRYDGELSLRPVERRHFFVLKRTFTIAEVSHKPEVSKDGTIGMSRFFLLTAEEIQETKEYIGFVTGHESDRPKTMVRLTCRALEQESMSISFWH